MYTYTKVFCDQRRLLVYSRVNHSTANCGSWKTSFMDNKDSANGTLVTGIQSYFTGITNKKQNKHSFQQNLPRINLAVVGEVGVVAEPCACLCCRKSVSESEEAIIWRFSSKFKKSRLLLRCGVTMATAVGAFEPCSGSETGESLARGEDFSVLGDILFCECCNK